MRRVALCCSPTTWKSARAHRTPQLFCARSGPSRGAPPTFSLRAAPKTAATARTRTALQHYYQYQVVLKPSPPDILELYLGSLAALGFDLTKNDVRFVEDDWENPTLGAWGLGWEVWLNGMEVTQFTYFQQVGGLECNPITGEITYGLERLAMYLQGKENVFDLVWTTWEEGSERRTLTYGDVYHQNEVEQSTYNFEQSNAAKLFDQFTFFENEAKRLLEARLALPGYEMILKAAHTFNLLDARGRDLGDRACRLHRPHSRAVAPGGPGLRRVARASSAFRCLPDAQRTRPTRAVPGNRGMSAATLVVELLDRGIAAEGAQGPGRGVRGDAGGRPAGARFSRA